MENNLGGQVHGISLGSFLQMVQMEKTTCTLKVVFQSETGFLYILNGELIDAEIGSLSHIDAALKIISWEEPVIEIEKICHKTSKEIHMPLMHILMEGLKIQDENKEKARQETAAAPEEHASPDGGRLMMEFEDENSGIDFSDDEPAKNYIDIETDLKPPSESEVSRKDEETPPEKKPTEIPSGVKKTPAKPEKSSRKIIIAAAVSITLAAAGAFAWFTLFTNGDRDSYQDLMIKIGTSGGLEDKKALVEIFINTEPDNKYIPKARGKLAEIQSMIEKRDYNEILSKIDKLPVDDTFVKDAGAMLKEYIRKYPSGSFRAKADSKLKELPDALDHRDFENLKKIPTQQYQNRIAAYAMYQHRYPRGLHISELDILIQSLADDYYHYIRTKAEFSKTGKDLNACIEDADAYLQNFSGSRNAAEIQVTRKDLQGRLDLVLLKEKTAKYGDNYLKSKKVYQDYLKANPETTVLVEVKNTIRDLDKKYMESKNWKSVDAYTKNPQHSVYDRIKKLNRYITKTDSDAFEIEAQQRLASLEDEKAALENARYKEKVRTREDELKRRRDQERLSAAREKQRIENARRQISSLIRASGNRFVINSNDTVTDSKTGLTWCLLDSKAQTGKCMNFTEAARYVDNLRTGGFSDWRMPNSSELVQLYKIRPFYPSVDSGSWYWTNERFWKGYHEMANIVTAVQETSWQKKHKPIKDCGIVMAVRP